MKKTQKLGNIIIPTNINSRI